MNRRGLYIAAIAVCSVIICFLIVIIITRDPKQPVSYTNTNDNNAIFDGQGNGLPSYQSNTSSFDIRMDKTTLNIGEKANATVTFKNGKAESVIWKSTGDAARVSSNGEITALQFGTARICAELLSNSNEYKCVEIKVANTNTDFKSKLISDYGYKEVSNNRYSKDKYTLDLSSKTFTFYEKANNESMLVYHFGRNENYVESVVKTPNYSVILKYTLSANQYDCEASPAGSQEYICNEVREAFIKNAHNMEAILKGYLEPNLSITDIN